VNFYPVDEIVEEVRDIISKLGEDSMDVISIVGDGEPTLYSELGVLIKKIKKVTNIPVAVITNGALLSREDVQLDLLDADIVLPSLDFYDELTFEKINRPHGNLKYEEIISGIRMFSQIYQGRLWIETMIIKGINDDRESIHKLKAILDTLNYEKLYINSPVRPVTELNVEITSRENLKYAAEVLGGILI